MTLRSQAAHAGGERGTSLLELLLVLSLMAVVLTMIMGSFGFGRRAWEAADRIEAQTQLDAAAALVRRLLAEAVPTRVIDTQGRQSLRFSGEESRVRFVANAQGTVTTAGLQEIIVESPAAPSGSHDLVLRLSVYRPTRNADTANTQDRVLVSGIDGVLFRYYGRERDNEAAEWHRAWLSKSGLPDLIEMTVALPENDERTWPVLVVEPKLR